MKDPVEPIELSVILALAEPPSLEEELTIEKQVLEIKEADNIEELKKYAECITRENYQQGFFIANCLEKIAELQARVICLQNPVGKTKERKKTTIERLFSLW